MTIYLYVKTHNKTGLKYLGKTTKDDPHTYNGSGTRWTNHLNKHGKDYSTEIIRECQTKEELTKWGIYYSDLWNIVKDRSWANIRRETGDGADTNQLWWNNGTEQVHSEYPPDDTYTRGRLPFNNRGFAIGAEIQRDKKWVTNGIEEYMTHDDLPEGYWYGRLDAKRHIRKKSAKGTKWWNNGVISKMSLECPDAGFVPGRLPTKRKRKDQTQHSTHVQNIPSDSK